MPTGTAYDVFLSYSRADEAAANRLRTRLTDAGLKPFFDRYSLPGGKPWQPELETALGHCRALVVLLGPAGIGGWQHREIQLGLIRQGAAEKTATPFPVIPVLLPNLQPDDVPLGTFLNLNTWVDLRPGLDEPEALQRLLAAAQGRAIDGLTSDLASLRPYRGLLPFREQDAGLYFGRQRFIDELVAKVRQRSASNLVAVLGRSGSGKSSIVFAGLFPALRKEKGSGQQAVWQILDLRPGAEPLHALIEAFDPPEPNLSRAQKLALINVGADLLRQRKVSLAQLVRDRLKDDPGTTRLLLYVDQWEELYTQAQKREAQTEDDRAHAADARLFVDLVLEAAATAPCTLVLSARSDFYADIQTHDALRAAVQDCQVSLGPMTAAELTAAIEGPARAVGGSVDPELTKKLLRDIGLDLTSGRDDQYDIGKLPLLEYALEQAWTMAASSRIGLGQYAGLEQALEERANQVFDRLAPKQQAAAKRLFVSLVTPGEGREDTGARFALPADPAMLAAAETFADASARLIVIGDDASGSRLAEVSHEALIRHWDKLRAWVDENREKLRIHSRLVADRSEWIKHSKDISLLIPPGLRLKAARRLRDAPGDVPVDDISDYIESSIEADRAAEAARTRREVRHRLGLAAEREIAEEQPTVTTGAQATMSGRATHQADKGRVIFDYSTNNGMVTVGAEDREFRLRFSKASDTSIYLYTDGTNLLRIARIKGARTEDIIEFAGHDSSSRHYIVRTGEHFMAENDKGFFIQGYIVLIQDDTRGAERDVVRFDYEIGDVGQSAFHALGTVVLSPSASSTGNAPESRPAISPRDLSVAEVMDRIEQYHLPPVILNDKIVESIIEIFTNAAKSGEVTVRGWKEKSAIFEVIGRDYWRTMTLEATRVLHRHEDGANIQTYCLDPQVSRWPPIYHSMVVERAQIDVIWPIEIQHDPIA